MKVKTKRKSELELKITLGDKEIEEFRKYPYWGNGIEIRIRDDGDEIRSGAILNLVMSIIRAVRDCENQI